MDTRVIEMNVWTTFTKQESYYIHKQHIYSATYLNYFIKANIKCYVLYKQCILRRLPLIECTNEWEYDKKDGGTALDNFERV